MAFYHSMKIYDDETSIAKVVAGLFALTLSLNQPCLIIARPSVNDRVKDGLAQIGIAGDRITIVTSDELLAAVIDDRLPDPVRFAQIVGGLLDVICDPREICITTIYTDMADILVSRRNTEGALRLEVLWNEMAERRTFTLVCGYSDPAMYARIPTLENLRRTCMEHNAVTPARLN